MNSDVGASGRPSTGSEESNNSLKHFAVEEPKVEPSKPSRKDEDRDSSSSASTDEYFDALTERAADELNNSDRRPTASSRLLNLPAELIDHICFFLSPLDLDAVAASCQPLRSHATKDLAWLHHIQDNVPGCTIKSPFPYTNYRELYFSHDPHWFLTKYKIWFSDYLFTGKIMIVRFDPRRGCIEGYRLVAERKMPEFATWEFDEQVIIHSFEPKVRLHMDLPVLQLDSAPLEQLANDGDGVPQRKFDKEIPMHVHTRSGTYSNFLLARRVVENNWMSLWPPLNIPAGQRVRNTSQEGFVGSGHKPQKRSEISDQAFRIRRWMRMAGPMLNTHVEGQVDTYATLDPKLYTPTADKPYRGIWVGDYSGHGCEFLLMHQADDRPPVESFRRDDESELEFLARRREERIYRGRLEAIKLTGDPNIPRGEFTFIAEDLGDDGFVRVADEPRFKGARVVKSKGHIAERNFSDHQYIESQLILISPDRLAQYWVEFGHISFYERVKIDQFISPFNDRPFATMS